MKIAAFVIFCVLPLFGIIAAIRVARFVRRGIRATAKIVGHKRVRIRPESSTSSELEDQYLPMIIFHDHAGIYRELTLKMERPIKMKGIGDDEIRIIYPPENPKLARIDYWASLWIIPIVLLAPAVILLVAYAWLYGLVLFSRNQ